MIQEWDYDVDRFSFEDSDRFEEDSLCSWISEPESLCNNWRGWKRQNGGQTILCSRSPDKVTPLVELSAIAVACHLPFEVVEHYPEPIPEWLQLRIAFWSFPENEEDIRLYSCLSNGSADEFTKGEHLYKSKAVKEVIQIGFHLSATILPPQSLNQAQGNKACSVAVVFDRRRITLCNCNCESQAYWCSHVVAVCLYRIHQANSVCLRAPVSESLSRLHRDQLQKFAQYLISALPQQILPTAQKLLDQLLSSQETAINTVYGAPDPTAGPPASEQTSWSLDESTLHENINKTLVKFCVPAPMVFSDVNYLSASAPPAAAEWQSLLRPLRGREPEGMWNLLSIVREMFRRHDSNSVPLLEIVTDEVLQCEQILIWWFTTKSSAPNNSCVVHITRSGNSSANATQHAAASLCEEIVTLWRLGALNPKLSPIQRDDLCTKFKDWHIATIEKVRKARSSSNNSSGNVKKNDIENFPGFKPAIEACHLTWEDYPIRGVTYCDKEGSRWVYHFSCKGSEKTSRIQPMTICSRDIISTDNSSHAAHTKRSQDPRARGRHDNTVHRRDDIDGAISSGSEGFCEPDRHFRDSDSSYENKLLHSRSNSLDEEHSTSESQQSGDEYQMYFYDTKAKAVESKKKNEEPNYFAGIKKYEDLQDSSNLIYNQKILFARAEALHAHGHTKDACLLAKQLAEEMLANPPDLLAESANVPTPKSKKKKALNGISLLASATLAKAAFLVSVLSEDTECHHLAFQVGMFGLDLPRPPASCKPLEVKLAYQESELLQMLKKIPLGLLQLNILRRRGEELVEGKITTRGEALLPLHLATFIFDSLLKFFPSIVQKRRNEKNCSRMSPADEKLGFDAAVTALGLKANVSEAEHPLLCESTRRQRGELAMTMLLLYKDDQTRLSRIMDKILDKEIHQQYKAPSLVTYLVNRPSTSHTISSSLSSNTTTPRDHHHHPSPQPSASNLDTLFLPERSSRQSMNDSINIDGLPPHNLSLPGSISGGARPKTTYTITGRYNRFKGKNRIMPTIPNQPSEASAHFMFELAKTILTKAGGNSSTSLFTQPTSNSNPPGPHRNLHICAFQIGLYALGLSNCVSPNWLSRTYSSHVSWITGQAMDIGSVAIRILIDTWEGHLTPPEVASLADRASRGRDPNMVRAAAELALSCLPHAHALNPTEVSRALFQCKEQSTDMLERACLAVETAAKGGGVFPEVLFDVGKHWYKLSEDVAANTEPSDNADNSSHNVTSPQLLPQANGQMATQAVVLPYAISQAGPHHGQLPHSYVPPYSYMQQVPAPFSHQYTQHHLPIHSIHPAYMAPYAFQNPTQFVNMQSLPTHPIPYHSSNNPAQFNYVMAAFRVGMSAMEMLARRVHDDRPQTKYARNPPYGEDVKWLLGIAMKLGTYYIQQFCASAVNAVVSPHILYDLALEAAKFMARNNNASHPTNPTHVSNQLRSNILNSLFQKCLQMFMQCAHQRIHHITQADYDEFVSIVCRARNAFYMAPGGMVQFTELLQSLRRSKSCRKELWQRIVNGLATGSV
ncbi:hypothetical protein LOTGIDRAFT_209983 [Lottia gigantea]|uniref:SWIM-type domain-containing protein n=1 Tax=Lottia gigantea TaxID=225164 RepID=V3ZD55_LOTGI|nr:hypothetical protein LOTGIDRAFT_209983 [Lottia gigantea]ESO89038.1 hypothetical protein LOTGIDRAFT_209983 [Lottia gigantea]